MGGRGRAHSAPERGQILNLIDQALQSGARQSKACDILKLSPRTLQRWRKQNVGQDRRAGPKSKPANKLSQQERQQVLETANSQEFCDLSPKQIVPRLADRGCYLASESTFYRILRTQGQVSRRGRKRSPTAKPREFRATGPNQVWTWDITYLPAAVAGRFLHLYLVVDVFSRKIVGWEIHEKESQALSSKLLERLCREQCIDPGSLVLHSDNGGPMKGATMRTTLERLGVQESFSRPRVSNDNPYSESLFCTLKYRPDYPRRPFSGVENAQLWVAKFCFWYNNVHLHSGIKFVTPSDRHEGKDADLLRNRRRVYEAAKAAKPERWSGKIRNWNRVEEVFLNPEPRDSSVKRTLVSKADTVRRF